MKSQKATYLTTNSEYEADHSIQKAMSYCEQNNLELQSIIHVSINRLIYEPNKIIEHLIQHQSDVVVTDDSMLLYPDISDYERTFLQQLNEAQIDCIHFELDESLLALARFINMQRSEMLTKQEHGIKGLIIYHGDENSRNEQEYQDMAETLKEKIQDDQYGALFYKEEHEDIYQAICNVVENNPIEHIMMQQPFIMEEGTALMNQLEEHEIEIKTLKDIELKQGQQLWNMN